tara:strand:+ start:180052 stop:180501 length:450 start_codon:yes stop_codon:yes gene_type:complete
MMPQGHVIAAESSLSRPALAFGLVLLCLDIGTKLAFGILAMQSDPFPLDITPSFLGLVVYPSLPILMALFWHRELVSRVRPAMYQFALMALAVGPLGGLFEWLYFERTIHLAAPELGIHNFFITLSQGFTILASLTLLGAALIGRRLGR